VTSQFTYEVQIKEHHLDTFGHVNNAIYLQLYEEARWQFITDRGYGLKEVLKYQKGPVVLEVNLKFLKELKLRENIKITFEAVDPVGSSQRITRMKQTMVKDNGDIASELMIVFGFFDLSQRKLIKATDEWIKVFA
jgi:YbgC/YbaW family acyl-CoA thioester hydrolase